MDKYNNLMRNIIYTHMLRMYDFVTGVAGTKICVTAFRKLFLYVNYGDR